MNRSFLEFRVLIVEDDENVLDNLIFILKRRIRSITITSATACEDALSEIDGAVAKNALFDLALLDFSIPSKKSQANIIDIAVCKKLTKKNVPTVHFSAFPNDPKIEHHIATEHSPSRISGPRTAFVTKTPDASWAYEILDITREYWTHRVSARVMTALGLLQLTSLPWSYEKTGSNFHFGHVSDAPPCGTHDVIQLYRDILDGWEDFSDELKEQVFKTFAIHELDGPEKRLSLFDKEKSVAERER